MEWLTRLPEGEASEASALGPAGVEVSVVVPTLNEAANLPFVLPKIPEWVLEVILVDGGSKDNTVEVARELRDDLVVIVEHAPGKGVALRRGFEMAKGDIIVMIDADGSMDPAEIPRFVGALIGGADFVKGSRFMHGGGTADMEWYRKLGNWGLTMAVRAGFGGRYSDLCYGYNAFWTRVLPELDLDAEGFEVETMMNIRALKAGLEVAEVASFEAARIHGSSNLNTVTDGWRVLRTIVRERLDDESDAEEARHDIDLRVVPSSSPAHAEAGQVIDLRDS
jgi:glycosyltransferase involved in cell wall biosynthesis